MNKRIVCDLAFSFAAPTFAQETFVTRRVAEAIVVLLVGRFS